MLLPGDVEAEAEQQLLAMLADQQIHAATVDLMLAPHHGSNTSSSQPWLDYFNPSVVISSTAYKNRYGHPSKKVLQRYRSINAKLLLLG